MGVFREFEVQPNFYFISGIYSVLYRVTFYRDILRIYSKAY